MAEGKYGRLFTEADVRMLLDYAVHRVVAEGETGLTRDADGNLLDAGEVLLREILDFDAEPLLAAFHGLTFAPDEPLFLLRGQDRLAAIAVESYWRACRGRSAGEGDISAGHVAAARAALQAFMDWQAEHPERVKAPD